uniref:Uncharacterized protein n=1 Tax=Ananas comosus var. bracteatus TaxID=296719 RepID=A0A6V7QBU4_ANACO|nr:unnamed protein product [Ananas comosus var. bracteatus]
MLSQDTYGNQSLPPGTGPRECTQLTGTGLLYQGPPCAHLGRRQASPAAGKASQGSTCTLGDTTLWPRPTSGGVPAGLCRPRAPPAPPGLPAANPDPAWAELSLARGPRAPTTLDPPHRPPWASGDPTLTAAAVPAGCRPPPCSLRPPSASSGRGRAIVQPTRCRRPRSAHRHPLASGDRSPSPWSFPCRRRRLLEPRPLVRARALPPRHRLPPAAGQHVPRPQ